jgi:hypothetical protein
MAGHKKIGITRAAPQAFGALRLEGLRDPLPTKSPPAGLRNAPSVLANELPLYNG